MAAVLIGTGSYGKVYKETREGQECAVKKISAYDEDDLQEVEILTQLRHKHVIEFRSYYIEQTNREPTLCIVMETVFHRFI